MKRSVTFLAVGPPLALHVPATAGRTGEGLAEWRLE
jgi:hypothetical protein